MTKDTTTTSVSSAPTGDNSAVVFSVTVKTHYGEPVPDSERSDGHWGWHGHLHRHARGRQRNLHHRHDGPARRVIPGSATYGGETPNLDPGSTGTCDANTDTAAVPVIPRNRPLKLPSRLSVRLGAEGGGGHRWFEQVKFVAHSACDQSGGRRDKRTVMSNRRVRTLLDALGVGERVSDRG